MRILPPAALLLSLTPLSAAPRIQSPDAEFLTLQTAHYRIHYPASGDFEAFAREVASRIEGVHALMEPWIGYALAGPTDVLVLDPVAMANGMTIAHTQRPHLVLWRTAPESDLEISHGRDWVEELVPHELVHLHHLTRPNRRPGLLDRYLWMGGQSALARKCPAWVAEGYATLMEGRLTGMGRPHGAYRAQILRGLAREGRLPSYQKLDEGAGRYLVSSAFLAWMEQQAPAKEKVFPELWMRLSSSRYPDFDRAFLATFGQGPEIAYGRFCAELTHDALEVETRVAEAGLREGERWGFVAHPVQDLSVSPDGTKLLGRVRSVREGGLCLWDLGAPLEGAEAQARSARRDPDLPAEVPELYPARKRFARLGTVDGQLPERPRWTAEGIAYRARRADAEGVYHRVERAWRPDGLKTDGQKTDGQKTDGLKPGGGSPIIEHVHPVWSGTKWTIDVDGKALVLPFEPAGPLALDRARRCAYATQPVQGIPNLVRMDFDPSREPAFGDPVVLTRTDRAALYPAPTPDGKSLYFVVPRLQGAEIRRLDLGETPGTAPGLASGLAPGITPWTEGPDAFTQGAVRPLADGPSLLPPPGQAPVPQPYRVSQSHRVSLRAGYVTDPTGNALQIGVGGSDILPRLDWHVLGSVGESDTHGEGPRGVMAGLTWRGWSWSPCLRLFSEYDRASQQRWEPIQGWDLERRGFELSAGRAWWNLGDGMKVQGALAAERCEDVQGGAIASRRLLWARAAQGASWESDGWRCSAGYAFQGALGRTRDQGWRVGRALVSMGVEYRWAGLRLEGEGGRMGGSPTALDAFRVGSQDHGLRPESLSINAAFQPALPIAASGGTRLLRWRAETSFGLYLEGISAWQEGSARSAFTRVAGLEVHGDSREVPILGDLIRRLSGSMEIRAGIHGALDGPTRHRGVVTLAILARI